MKVGDLVRFKHAMQNDALFIITRVNVSKIKSDNSDYQTLRIWNLAEGTIAIHHSFLQVVS
jgi:hypothetical protein